MVRKPNSMYREIRGHAYTRKEYMGGVPDPRISRFDFGKQDGPWEVEVSLVVNESGQIRSTALEAARITATRYISKMAGNAYYIKIRLYPHQVLRENKVATGAGADRISDGMRLAFGVPIGTAARTWPGTKVMSIRTTAANRGHAQEAIRKAGSKLASPSRILVEPVRLKKRS